MTDEQWEKIRPAAEKKAEARIKFENLMATNTPTDLRERVELQMAVERAIIKMGSADADLVTAMGTVAL